jgi:hypothetical protein
VLSLAQLADHNVDALHRHSKSFHIPTKSNESKEPQREGHAASSSISPVIACTTAIDEWRAWHASTAPRHGPLGCRGRRLVYKRPPPHFCTGTPHRQDPETVNPRVLSTLPREDTHKASWISQHFLSQSRENPRASGALPASKLRHTNLSTLYQSLRRSLRRSLNTKSSSPNMFGKRSFASSKDRSGKISKQPKRSFRETSKQKQQMIDKMESVRMDSPMMESVSPSLTSAIVTIIVGADQRLFAAHEDVLCHSPYFAEALRGQFFESTNRRIDLPTEEPEVFSCILEYLYKGDYYPRLVHDKRRQTWMLEGAVTSPDPNKRGDRVAAVEPTFFHSGVNDIILRDTAVYCAANRYGLEELQKLSLRKQGLQSGIEVGTILRSARYAYENTPDSDSRLRAHYLALIIRSRKTFKRSGTMQMEMELGGKLFFDLFVAMCNHVDDIVDAR